MPTHQEWLFAIAVSVGGVLMLYAPIFFVIDLPIWLNEQPFYIAYKRRKFEREHVRVRLDVERYKGAVRIGTVWHDWPDLKDLDDETFSKLIEPIRWEWRPR